MSAARPTVAVLTPMRSELAPFRRLLDLTKATHGVRIVHRGHLGAVQVVVVLTEIGMEPARRTTRWVLDTFGVDHVMVSGVAGGIGAATAVGHLVVPDVVIDGDTGRRFVPSPIGGLDPRAATPVVDRRGSLVSSDTFLRDRSQIDQLDRDGVTAVDMETAAVAEVCEGDGVEWSVYRGISDHVDDTHDDAVLALVRPDGSPDLAQVARYIARDPRRVTTLVALGRGATTAARTAAGAAVAAIGAYGDRLEAGDGPSRPSS